MYVLFFDFSDSKVLSLLYHFYLFSSTIVNCFDLSVLFHLFM